ncbi:MAG: hypothetical protein UU73_C0003G0305 [Candidatus Daviesbacteria bacterium GW2011_GWA1_41_61]|uniref:DUF5666 domain-containing protein n=1 Tax=Candidatus Daviesbacteria bacterium GW2011_GWA2_40_9 TaxID=1618424 RepID=A0A0G0U0M8_9BACT|nr:MAG: hypothetical protein UU26_C0035G0006 [Candidatus Daviesbacteria bacterium GW2011_GWC1_40_9]KKR82699.1 MAG: hypothetical protein UU29_C0010G0045 [Candidatus Daviesbacteria bacterium GW2011_GWA2_40_9]KKR93345.1 MAG: hypothetical protein UU44_C0002G0006 [Candidatus Daviesbacteria bacterium GW2011_GWB1_41_15]KKS15106.1 MAG: hypothetical protein UU73_C0003G0305 [Candidatus Daviesbacteria bacterium GW2011_GWA1_41_61]
MSKKINFKLALISVMMVTGLMMTLDVYGKLETNPGQSNRPEDKKVTIGEVEKVNGATVTIKDKKQNEASAVTLDSTTKVVGKNNKAVKLNSIKPKDIVALISTDSATATTAGKVKKITKVYVKSATSSAQSKRRAIQGVITAINSGNLTLAHQIQRDRIYNIITTAQTAVKIKGIEDSTVSALVVGQRIVAVGNLNELGVLVAQRIHVIPGKASGIFKKYPLPSTGSATPSASPSATVTPTSTVSATPTEDLTPTISLTATPTASPSSTPTVTP